MAYVALHQLAPFPGPVPPVNPHLPVTVRGQDNAIVTAYNAHDADSTIHLTGGGTSGTLTFGTHLTSGGASFNGSANVTITSDATSANTASTIVARDANGDFAMRDLAARNGVLSGTLGVTGTSLFGAPISIGTVAHPEVVLALEGAIALTGTDHYGIVSQNIFQSNATNLGVAGAFQVKTAAAAFTMATARAVAIADVSKGAGSAVTNSYGIYIDAITAGATNNFAIYTNAGAVRFGDTVSISTANNQAFAVGGAGTSWSYGQWSNTGGSMIFGVDSSVGTLSGTAYAGLLQTTNATALTFATNNVTRLTLAATGGALFAGIVTMSAPLTLKGYTVATLPAGVVGHTAYCTDLLAPGFLVAAVGGGAVVGPVFYNGAAWVAY